MHRIPFVNLPGFSKYDDEGFEHLFPTSGNAREQYVKFKIRIFAGINQCKYIPVMRMCDGEYIYSVGRKRGYHEGLFSVLKIFIATLFNTQTTSWGEKYSRTENKELKKRFVNNLKFISKHGYIANHFLYNRHHFCEEYIEPMKKWYAKHGIEMRPDNFVSFFFVYVLLNGPDSLDLFKNQKVLVLSSFAGEKITNIKSELKRRGALEVFFESVSATSSMLDVLEITSYKGKVDLVLIAAGIGSSNILCQCEPLSVPCIDSGFCLECIANPAVRSQRIFCVPDNEF